MWLLLVHPQAASVSTTLSPPAPKVRAARLHSSRPPAAVTARRPIVSSPALGPSATLTWSRAPGAAFYDLVLLRSGQRVLDLWPTTAHVVVPKRWTFHGKRFALTDGSYQWFAYPASGTRQAARYGPLTAHGSLNAG